MADSVRSAPRFPPRLTPSVRAPAATRIVWEWCMNIRFYRDQATGEPHIYNHGVRRGSRRGYPSSRGRPPWSGRFSGGHWSNTGWEVLASHLCARPRARQYICHHRIRVAGEAAGGLSTAAASERTAMRQDRFPPGWDEERVRKVLTHYEEQTEDEAVAEDEAAIESRHRQ